MKKASIFLLACTLIFTLSCKKDKKESDTDSETQVETTQEKSETKSDAKEVKKVTVVLSSKSGSTASGNAVFKQEGGMVSMLAVISGLDEGTHAIHLHEKSDCSSDDGKSTGGHWNPTAKPHGEWGADDGYHQGDIGNFTANADGNGTKIFATNQWCIGCGDDTKDILGKAIVIHQGTDDFTSQPSGAAGGRISCGGIIE